MSLRKSTQRQHVPGPAFVCHVQKEHPGSIGIVGAVYPGQEVIDVILGKHHLFDSGKQLRLLLPHPQKLRSREAGKGDVGRPLGEPVPAHGLVQVGNLLCCPAVVPQNGGADDPVLLVQDHQAVHLTAGANAGHLAPVEALQEKGDSLPHGLLPVRRVLLAPARPGEFQGIVPGNHMEDLPRFVHQQQLHCRGAQINSNVQHHIPRLSETPAVRGHIG